MLMVFLTSAASAVAVENAFLLITERVQNWVDRMKAGFYGSRRPSLNIRASPTAAQCCGS
jgi:hypothetical protein